MNKIITVNVRIDEQIDKLVTDSRNVAEVFGKRHDNVLRDIESIKKDVLNFEEMFFEGTMPDSYGREQKVYFMNRDGFTLLAMGFTGTEAMQFKLKYINAFNEMEKVWNSPEQIMARALKVADNTINSLKRENQFLIECNAEMKPKAQFADAITASDDCILIREMATILTQNGVETGERKLYQSLREEGYICKGSTKPTQKAMNMGLFEITERPIDVGYTTKLSQTTKVTPKGQQFFINKFLA